MNMNTNKKSKNNFMKQLIKEEKKGLKLIGCTLLCLTLFLTGMHFGSNRATCYTDSEKAIEIAKKSRVEFTEEYNDIIGDIINNYYDNSTYGLEECQVTYELGIMTEMIINNINKDLLIDECDSLINQINEDSINLVNAYKLKQLIMEKY